MRAKSFIIDVRGSKDDIELAAIAFNILENYMRANNCSFLQALQFTTAILAVKQD